MKKSLARLKAIPFVCYAGADGDTRATLWRFSDFVQRTKYAETEPLFLNTRGDTLNAPACNSSIGSVTALLDMLQSDALERGALGITGWWVYITLLNSPSPTAFKDIAERAGLSEGQVRYALRKDGWLRKTGLVERVKSGWLAKAVTCQQLDEIVARPAGKLGKSAKRAAVFAKERAINAGREIAFSQRKRMVIQPVIRKQSSFVGQQPVAQDVYTWANVF